ncbi:cadherin-like domain-containing protein [Micrococcales bacterium 31B]|nr:cadherin-like domain-containing protein [Micrococcales bacterium 31B]
MKLVADLAGTVYEADAQATISAVAGEPQPDSPTAFAGEPTTINVLANDTAVAPWDPSTVAFPTAGQPAGATVSTDGKTLSVPNVGTYEVQPDGTIVFTPADGYSGTAPDVTYEVKDVNGTPATGTLAVTVVEGSTATGSGNQGDAVAVPLAPEGTDPATLAYKFGPDGLPPIRPCRTTG